LSADVEGPGHQAKLVPGEVQRPVGDPDALRIDPDPSSKSGKSAHTISYPPTAGSLLTVITVTEDLKTYGVNGWRSNPTDIRRYREESS
jgi:hypothetical protein